MGVTNHLLTGMILQVGVPEKKNSSPGMTGGFWMSCVLSNPVPSCLEAQYLVRNFLFNQLAGGYTSYTLEVQVDH